jgi:hypothetical protein
LAELHTTSEAGRRALGAAARASIVEHYSFASVTRELAGLWAELGQVRNVNVGIRSSGVESAV